VIPAADLRAALTSLGETAQIDGQPVQVLVRRQPLDAAGFVESSGLFLYAEAEQVGDLRKGATVSCTAGQFKVRKVERDSSGLFRVELGA
jgi:hypothetical protein